MEEVLVFLKEILPTVDFADGNNLISKGILDSLAIITIVMEIPEKFGVCIDAEDISVENFDSVEKIAELIERKKGNA